MNSFVAGVNRRFPAHCDPQALIAGPASLALPAPSFADDAVFRDFDGGEEAGDFGDAFRCGAQPFGRLL